MWLQRGKGQEAEQEFLDSTYCQCWNKLINSSALNELLEHYGKRAVFCLHRNMAAFQRHLCSKYDTIQVFNWQDVDISELIRKAGTLITDFSSIFMDFAYMKKPMIYYQFDKDDFRKGHLPVGYFDYERDGFGEVCIDETNLIQALEEIFCKECQMSKLYRERVDRFYTLQDDRNCERTFKAIKRLLED